MKSFLKQLRAPGILSAIIFVLLVGGIGDAALERFVFPHMHFFDNRAPIVINKREEIQINDGLNNIEIINRVKNSLPVIYLGSGEFGTAQFHPATVFSGVVVSSDGIIAVPAVNLKGNFLITAVLADGTHFPATLLATDSLTGLAFLKIAAEGLPVLNQGSSSDLRAGEKLLAIRAEESPLAPIMEPLTVTAAPGPEPGFVNVYNTARLNSFLPVSGNTKNLGGVVVDRNSALVGFITQIGKDTRVLRGENFSLAAGKLLADKKISWADPKLNYLVMSEVQTKILGKSKRFGIEIKGDSGLLKDDDFIYALDDSELANSWEFQDRILAKRIGDKLQLKLIRDGHEIELEIKL